jgi:uncharacterized membrane protein YidH (DUF202 family)
MTDSDTLKNAELGETAAYENELEWYGFNTVPDDLNRRDLTQKLTDAEAEIVTNEHGNQDVVVTVEGEVMKTLPRRWESFPREQPSSVENTKKNTLATVLSGLVATGISVLVISRFNQAMSNVTVNGEPLGPVPIWEFLSVILFVFALVVGGYTLVGGLLNARRKA